MRALAAVLAMLILGACGQKGPLYFAPEPEPAEQRTAPDDTEDEKRE